MCTCIIHFCGIFGIDFGLSESVYFTKNVSNYIIIELNLLKLQHMYSIIHCVRVIFAIYHVFRFLFSRLYVISEYDDDENHKGAL